MNGAYEAIKESIAAKFPNGFPPEFSWAHLYEKSLMELFGMSVSVMPGLMESLMQFGGKHDPNLAVTHATNLSDVESMVPPEDSPLPESKETAIAQLAIYHGFLRVMVRNTQSVAINGLSVTQLLSKAQAGDDEALFKAMRIDNAVALLPLVQQRWNSAQLSGDAEFLNGHKNAFSYDPAERLESFSSLDTLRLAYWPLSEWPGIEEKSTSEIMAYLREDVGLTIYANEDEAFRKNLNNLRRS
jgi:hypothetical protein